MPKLAPVPASHNRAPISFGKQFVRGIALGIPGVISLLLVLPTIPDVPRLALLINPILLLCAMSAAGAIYAARVGLVSKLVFGESIRGEIPVLGKMLGLGILIGMAVAGLDEFWDHGTRSLIEAWSSAQFLVGVLYGGITEEILMRWGLLSFLLWGVFRLFGIENRKRNFASGVALCLSATVFAAGHLPAALINGDPTQMLIMRVLGLNFALGLVFGLAFLRYHLEGAIAVHVGFHVGVAILAVSTT